MNIDNCNKTLKILIIYEINQEKTILRKESKIMAKY